jgi:hypothetical protein
MTDVNDAIRDFLAQTKFAVAGASTSKTSPGNSIYHKLRAAGHTVYAVNPNHSSIDGATCYPDLKSLPETVDAVVATTSASGTDNVLRQCAELGITRVWLHQSLRALGSSVSDNAVQFCKDHHITVIPGGCPMMFCEPVDVAHKCIRWLSKVTGNLPTEV